MHRVQALKQLRQEDSRYKTIEMRIEVYPEMSDYTQCILADSNDYLIVICFVYIIIVFI